MMTVSAKEDIALAFYRACNIVFAQRGCTKLVNVQLSLARRTAKKHLWQS